MGNAPGCGAALYRRLEGGIGMKHAWLVIAHNEFEILQRLIDALDHPGSDIYVHIDKKVKEMPKLRAGKSRLYVLDRRLDVRWGSVSQIACELAMFEAAASRGPYDYYHVISGTTLPLKPFSELDAFFRSMEGKSVLTGLCKDDAYQETLKMRRYNLFLRNFQASSAAKRKTSQFLWKSVIAVQRMLGIEANKGKDFYKASNWLSLTQEAVQYILSRKEKILSVYRYTLCGDEFFVPSELMSSSLKDRIISHEQYLLQEMGRATTGVFPLDALERMKGFGYLFARKFTSR